MVSVFFSILAFPTKHWGSAPRLKTRYGDGYVCVHRIKGIPAAVNTNGALITRLDEKAEEASGREKPPVVD
jgi:hypothetical protein